MRKTGHEKVVVFLPTLDEESGAPLVIRGLREQGLKEIVVVDGGSEDGTVAACKKEGVVVMAQQGKGKGNAFKSFLAAYPLEDDSVVLMLDSDASYLPSDAPKLLQKIWDGAEVASGKRAMLMHDLKSLLYSIAGRISSVLISLLLLKWHPDFTTGYWAFRGSALKKMSISAQGFELEANFFAETAKKGLKLAVVPVGYVMRVGKTKLTLWHRVEILYALLKYRFY